MFVGLVNCLALSGSDGDILSCNSLTRLRNSLNSSTFDTRLSASMVNGISRNLRPEGEPPDRQIAVTR